MQPRLVAAACVLLMMIPQAVSVQEGNAGTLRWWRVPPIQRHLRLTPSQIATLDTLFERERPDRIDRQRQIEAMDRRLARIMERVGSGDDSVLELSAQVEALRAQQNIRRTLMLFAMYQTLTDEQRALLTHLHRAGRGSSASQPGRR